MRLRRKFVVLLGFAGRVRIDFFQITERKRRIGGIFPGVIGVKIAKIRLAFFQRGNNQSHLQSPVAEMNVADRVDFAL